MTQDRITVVRGNGDPGRIIVVRDNRDPVGIAVGRGEASDPRRNGNSGGGASAISRGMGSTVGGEAEICVLNNAGNPLTEKGSTKLVFGELGGLPMSEARG